MNKISNLAYVHPDAKIGDNVVIDPFVYIEGNVEIGDNCHIRPNAVIRSGARIGNNNHIFEGAIIAATPQDFRWHGEDSFVIIGDNNTIREHVIINRSIHEGGATKIGNNSFILSSNALVHERCDVGAYCLIKGGCRVNNHVPPYTVMAHNPIEYKGINSFVLRKCDFDEATIDEIASAYRLIYHANTSVFNALRRIRADIEDIPQKQEIITFIENHRLELAAAPKDLNETD